MQAFDFDDAIAMHRSWKMKFHLALDRIRGKDFDTQTIGDEALCGLGQWLSANSSELAGYASASELLATHEEFHRRSELIADAIKNGRIVHLNDQAIVEFGILSEHIEALLVKFKVEVGQSGSLLGNPVRELGRGASASASPEDRTGHLAQDSNDSQRKAQELRAKIRARRGAADRSMSDAEADESRSEAKVPGDNDREGGLEAEMRVRLKEEEQAQASRLAEEQARREEEDAARAKAEERDRLEAEDQARRLAEEKSWREAEEKFKRDEAEARSRQSAKAEAAGNRPGPARQRKWGKSLALGLAFLLLAVLIAIHVISFDGQIPQFEKMLAAQFQHPVEIKALRLSLLPQPHLKLEDVSIGAEGQIRLSRVKALGAPGNLFADRKVFKSFELDSPVVTEEGLAWIAFGKSLAKGMDFGPVRVLNVSLESKNVRLPPFEAVLQPDGEGGWKTIAIESTDKNLGLELTPNGESVQFEFKARSLKIPFSPELLLEDILAKGTADRAGISVMEFKSFTYGGILGGTGRLKWGPGWSLGGELSAKQIDAARLVPGLLSDGRLLGTASYLLQSPEAAKLPGEPRMEGNFSIARGVLAGVDFGRMLQGGAMQGDTRFAELTGSFVHDHGATQFRQMSLTEGAMTASGIADVDAGRNVRGRFTLSLKLPSETVRANLVAGGTTAKVDWRR